MNSKKQTLVVIIGIILVVLISLTVTYLINLKSQNMTPTEPPSVYLVLWAWERPEDMRFLEKYDAEIAYLAGSAIIRNSGVFTYLRKQPLTTSLATPKTAVVRIDHYDSDMLLAGNTEYNKLIDFIIRLCTANSGVSMCQLDYDAVQNEQDWYSELISTVRGRLPKHMQLSITALASWCYADSWLDSLPIDDAVPMFFDLGVDEDVIQRGQVGSTFMKSTMCQKSIGISTNYWMPDQKYLQNRTVYVFNPKPWTSEDYSNILKSIKLKLTP